MGGVGGYFGGLLAQHFYQSEVEIYFVVRGEHEQVIRRQGLSMETMNGNFIATPVLATSHPSEIGVVDLLVCCMKGYDLEDAIINCRPCVGPGTVLLPLLNGVDASERIAKIFPDNETWEGCVYLVSRLVQPGLVKETGNVRTLFFGSENGNRNKLQRMEQLFREAGIDATWSQDIRSTTWEKFLFISPIATLTSFLDKTIGEVFANKENENLLKELVAEVKTVADAKGIRVSAGITQKNLDKMKSLPAGTTTSMHSDFRKGGRTELKSLTGYVIRSARAFNVSLPTYLKMYEKLKQ